jgi:hypothetical protein
VSFQTPSDRFRLWLGRLFLLKPLSSRRIIKTIWLLAFLVYGFELFVWVFSVPAQHVWRELNWATLVLFLMAAPLQPLLWLLMLRLVLEACGQALRGAPASHTAADRPRSCLRSFFLLEPLSSRRVIKAIWILAFVVYGFELLGWALSLPAYRVWYQANWAGLVSFFMAAPLRPVLWLLTIRLVLEVCDRALAAPPGKGEMPAATEQ